MINIKTDSRKVLPGDTFVAIKGYTVDGHDFINDAIKNGATKIIAEYGEYDVETVITDNTEEYLRKYLIENYSTKFNDIKFIGITGTNGKTTTAYLTSKMLTELNINNSYIGTIGFYINGEFIRELPNTTPEILTLYNLILESIENNVNVIVMEVSSHSLSLNRISGIKFDIAGFTNLTIDHLDYHKTMENYLDAKKLILNYIKDDGIMISNIDDPYGLEFKYKNFKTLGFNKSDYHIIDYSFTNLTTNISFEINNQKYEVETNLLNKFNIYNYITALAFVNNLGVDIEEILKITNKVYAPSGRNEIISVNDGKAIIDYAHTPDALEKIILSTLENKQGKIITIFGCGGNRDPKKRPIMGNLATELSDYVILTNDNPRCEDETNIIKDILSGIKTNNYEIIYDRALAIKKGLDMIGKNDTLLILGKGHEDYQIIGHEKIHLSDKEEVLKYKKD
ncbi:MAG: UDP-N-acetylmuramoyl-L-alanyl-D-glutamate--2,6-diaminopimelate ligase [Bacilli bacterium]|nr:UDP-N-acetylmuramoyl-L-alanyl-D-glutamate--2,6-diaminopimelate ligase [Bacilli bacterium]